MNEDHYWDKRLYQYLDDQDHFWCERCDRKFNLHYETAHGSTVDDTIFYCENCFDEMEEMRDD